MSLPPITPLAQRLAEENNVDWRSLEGSGEGGRVVEGDVLAYLTQVMMGHAAADPTPEPLPEGLAAWPEEAVLKKTVFEEARKGTDDGANDRANDRVKSLWTLEPFTPHHSSPEAAAEAITQGTGTELFTEVFTFHSPPSPTAPLAAQGAEEDKPDLLFGASPSVSGEPSAASTPFTDATNRAHQAALEEVRELRVKLAQLQEERARHLDELHQLARLQETIDAQKAEKAQVLTLQNELRALAAELAGVRSEAARLPPLEAKLHDLEERLSRARLFRTKAKAEVERLLAYSGALEGELATLKIRPRWKFWG